MGRQLRFDPPGGLHHVMHRGSRRQRIFEDDADRRRFIERLDETIERHDVVVHAYALMATHYHLLVELPDGGISAAMKHLNSTYAQDFNWRHGYDGHLFRGRFHSLVVGDDEYLVEVVRYIHRNSVVAGVHPRAGDDVWNSHNNYLSGRVPPWLTTHRVLDYFRGDRQKFGEFVDAPDSATARAVIEALDRRRPAVGPDAFLRRLVGKPATSGGSAGAHQLLAVPIGDLATRAACVAARGNRSRLSATNLALVAARRAGCTSRELADFFGLCSIGATRNRLHRLEQRAKDDPTFESLIHQVLGDQPLPAGRLRTDPSHPRFRNL